MVTITPTPAARARAISASRSCGELREIEVAVVVDEHHAFFFGRLLASRVWPSVGLVLLLGWLVSFGLDVAREHARRLGQNACRAAAGPPRPAP